MDRDSSRRWVPLSVVGAAIAVASLLGLGACTGSGSVAPSGPGGPATTTGASPSSGASSAGITVLPRSTQHLPSSDPSPLTTVPTFAVRTLAPVPLRSTAAFGTGVTARVTNVTHGTDHDRGPGADSGRPTVLFHLRLDNGSGTTIAVSTVQVLASYGNAATPAIAATTSTRPFTGTLHAGRSASAVYAFAVPSDGQDEVSLTVSYTAQQPTVLLTGSAR